MRFTIDISWWTMRRFLHWWMCQRNPDKEIEWVNLNYDFSANPWFHLDSGFNVLSETQTIKTPIGSREDHSISEIPIDDPLSP